MNQIAQPQFRDYSDPRGVRTAWSSSVIVQGHEYRARLWRDHRYLKQSREDAAEVAYETLSGISVTKSPYGRNYGSSTQRLGDHTPAEEPNVDIAVFSSQTAPTVRSTPITVRGQWTCACGDVIYDDYLEHVDGAVEAAMKELRSCRSSDRLPTPITNSAPRRMLKDFSSSVYDGLNTLTGILRKTFNRWRHRKDDDEDPSNNGRRMNGIHEDESHCHEFLFLCISQWKRYYLTKMIPIDLKINSDDALFQLLRINYNLMIGPWRRLLLLRRVSDIRFVQFHTTKNSIIAINLHSCESRQTPPVTQPDYLPPQGHPEYSYKPAPITMEPPVGHNTMLHRYRCPKECGGLDFCLKRFPKHINGKVIIESQKDEATAWGIELVEGRDWLYLWFVGLLAILCSMIFGIVWARVMKDVSGGFTVAGYIVTAFACLVGTIQISLETL